MFEANSLWSNLPKVVLITSIHIGGIDQRVIPSEKTEKKTDPFKM